MFYFIAEKSTVDMRVPAYVPLLMGVGGFAVISGDLVDLGRLSLDQN